jgi:hypothetical protein
LNQSDDHYDVFVIHASEDKDSIARPLAQRLKDLGLKVWYDDFSLRIGDKLRESIDSGLSKSKFGIVILSKNFFAKEWPKLEFEGLVTLSVKNISRILPIWHEVNFNDVMNFSPMLASIKALPTSTSPDEVAFKIYEVVTNKTSQSSTPTPSETPLLDESGNIIHVSEIQNKRFRFLLKLYEDRDRTMIKNYPNQIGEELGYTAEVTREIVQYFDDKGFIEYPIIGAIEITVHGMDYIESLIPNAKEVMTVRSNRIRVLKELYYIREQYWGTNMFELGNKLGFSDDKVTQDVIYYLQVQGLIEFPQLGPNIKITTYGIDIVENSAD